jgi:hypothetical protein
MAIAACAAILTPQIQGWIRHPEYKVNFEPYPPDCNRIPLAQRKPVQTQEGLELAFVFSAETHYVRVRVQNIGKAGAEDLEVSALEVRHRVGPDPHFQPMQMSTPWNLTWKDLQSNVLPRLPPGGQRHFDIGHVVDPKKRGQILGEDRAGSDPSTTLFCLAFFVKSNTGEYLLDPGEYEIDFQVFAANANPSAVFTFHLNHTGKWFEDETQMYRDDLGGMRVTKAG